MERFSTATGRSTAAPVRRANRRLFGLGVVCGVLCVAGARLLLNNTGFADRLVAPLILRETTGKADAIVVLGAGLVGPCVLNLNSLRRVILAAQIWHEGRAPLVVFTGGVPKGLSCAVAAQMADFAARLGVPRNRMRLETASRSTHENATLSTPILRAEPAKRLLIVTDRLHMSRAAGVFAHAGFEIERASVPVYEGHRDSVDMLLAGARGSAAIVYYRLRGWL